MRGRSDAGARVRRQLYVGLTFSGLIAFAWLIDIVAERAWWQLALWAVFVPVGLLVWCVQMRCISRGRSASDASSSEAVAHDV